MAGGRCFSRVRGGVYEYTPVVCVCMCVIGVSTCACVPQLCRQSLGTLQLGSAACIHAFQLPQTSCTRHSCLHTRCLHVCASQPTAGVYRVVRALVDMVASSVGLDPNPSALLLLRAPSCARCATGPRRCHD